MSLSGLSTYSNAIFIPRPQVTVTFELTSYGCLVTRKAAIRDGKRRVTRRLPLCYEEIDFILERLTAAKAELASRDSAEAIEPVSEGETCHE